MLKKLTLTNFKKHRKLEVDFTDGLNVILGPNFCGKSTLLKAIAVVRYGVTAAGRKAKIVTEGEKKWKIELVEHIAGEDHTIIRTGSTAKVINSDNEVVAESQSAVTKWVADNCGADLDDFVTHTYSKQMETSTLLTLGATKMQNKVEKLASVDVVDKVLKLITKKNAEINGKLELFAEIDMAQLKGDYDVAKTQYKIAEEALDKVTKSLKDNEAEYKEDVNFYSDQLQLSTERSEVWGYLKSAEVNANQYDTDIEAKQDELAKLPQVYDELQAKSNELQEMKDALITEQTSAMKRTEAVNFIAECQNWITNVGQPNLKIEQKLAPEFEKLEAEYDELEIELLAADKQLSISQTNLSQLQEGFLGETCPTCGRDFDGSHIEHHKKQVAKMNHNVTKWENVTESLSLQLGQTQEAHDELSEHFPGEGHAALIKKYEDDIKNAELKLQALGDGPMMADIEDMQKNLEPLQDEVDAFKVAVEARAELESDIMSMMESLEYYNEQVVSLSKDFKALPEVEIDLDESKQVLDEMLAVINGLKQKKPALDSNLAMLSSAYAVAKDRLKRAKDDQKKAKKLRKQLGLYKKLSTYLRQSRTRFLNSVWDGILSRATEIVASATAGDDDQITQIARNDKGEFTYYEKGVEFGMGDASGCQLEMMGVSLRLALCDLFYGHGSYMMLDEASSQMNNENAAALAGVLSATGKQIIYVTHRQTEETTAENVIQLGQ